MCRKDCPRFILKIMAEQQNYQNHTRWYPLQHFIITPLLLINFVRQIYNFFRDSSMQNLYWIFIAFMLILIALAARLQALKAQDRVIRLEEKMRYREILPKELAAAAVNLPMPQIIALRFASDAELSELVQKIINGELKESKEIKQAIKNWRGDYLRV